MPADGIAKDETSGFQGRSSAIWHTRSTAHGKRTVVKVGFPPGSHRKEGEAKGRTEGVWGVEE